MLLAIDSGNTNTLFAIHDGKDWTVEWWFHQLLSMQALTFKDITDCVISTVVPQSLFNMRNLARRYFDVDPIVIGDEGVDVGIGVRIDNPKEVGADRLVTALGASKRYPGNLIIIDSGTATTFDILSADGFFEGGIIAPGINLSVRALHEAAAQLPRIAIIKPDAVIGTSTVSAMQSGIFWGYIELIDGLVRRIQAEDSRPFTVIGTGGVASLFEGASQTIQHYDSQLTINGLLEVWRLNS